MLQKVFFLIFMSIGVGLNAQNKDFENLLHSKADFEAFLKNSDDSMKLAAIEYLLSMEGSKNVNTVWYGYTSLEKQSYYNSRISLEYAPFRYCTEQLVALYLISALYHSNIAFCEKIAISFLDKDNKKIVSRNLDGNVRKKVRPFPRRKFLSKTKYRIKEYRRSGVQKSVKSTYRYRVVDNKIIKDMYIDYKRWFLELKCNGFENTAPPVLSHSIEWFNESSK